MSSSSSLPSLLTEQGTPGSSNFAQRWRQRRSCARCHRLRLKCTYDDPTYLSCRRCFAIGVECSLVKDPTSANARKINRKKNEKDHLATLQTNIKEIFETYVDDSSTSSELRVAKNLKVDSIQKIHNIQTQLTELQQFLSHVLDSSEVQLQISSTSSSINSMKDGPVKMIPMYPSIPYQYNIVKELLKLKLIDRRDSEKRFHTFIDDMLSYWPNVSLPSDYLDFNYLLENRPLILLACISVTLLNEPNLHDLLLYYLERNMAQRVCITGDISVDLIYVYTILSLWASPPKKWGSFKHQMNLLMALNLSLCLDSPNQKFRSSERVLYTNSEERKLIRCYISVYSCCGCLGLSLPKFRCVSWNKDIAGCCDILLMGETTRADRFLCYYARLVGAGQEIYDYFSDESKINQLQLGDRIAGYEKKLQTIMNQSELFTSESKERYLLFIIYYQFLMSMHDYVVCDVVKGQSTVISEVYLSSLSKLIMSCEKIVDSFVKVCDVTLNIPTFFYYRPMHALVAMIRTKLLVVYEKLDIDVNVEREYERVKECLEIISDKCLVLKKMSIILTRVEKWMRISVTFNKEGASNSMELLLGELGDEKVGVENLKPPVYNEFVQETVADVESRVEPKLEPEVDHPMEPKIEHKIAPKIEPQEENTIQDFFNEIDRDFLNIQFMDNAKTMDNENNVMSFINDLQLDGTNLLNADFDPDNFESLIGSGTEESFGDFLRFEATGQISRNNSLQ